MRHLRGDRAFVLFEVILAVAIGGLVFLVLMNGFSSVTQGYRRILSAPDARVRLFAALLGEDLRSAYKEGGRQEGGQEEDGQEAVFSFTARPVEVCFVRTRPLGSRAEVDVADGLIRVCYGWSSSAAGEGKLTRRVYSRSAGAGAPDRERVLLEGLAAMRWNYYDGMQWSAAWGSAERLPRLVRVVFSIVRERGRLKNYETVFELPAA